MTQIFIEYSELQNINHNQIIKELYPILIKSIENRDNFYFVFTFEEELLPDQEEYFYEYINNYKCLELEKSQISQNLQNYGQFIFNGTIQANERTTINDQLLIIKDYNLKINYPQILLINVKSSHDINFRVYEDQTFKTICNFGIIKTYQNETAEHTGLINAKKGYLKFELLSTVIKKINIEIFIYKI